MDQYVIALATKLLQLQHFNMAYINYFKTAVLQKCLIRCDKLFKEECKDFQPTVNEPYHLHNLFMFVHSGPPAYTNMSPAFNNMCHMHITNMCPRQYNSCHQIM